MLRGNEEISSPKILFISSKISIETLIELDSLSSYLYPTASCESIIRSGQKLTWMPPPGPRCQISKSEVCAIILPSGYEAYGTVHLEMLHTSVAIRTWGNPLMEKSVLVQSYNQAVVAVLTLRRTKDMTSAAMA